jgi:asparagine synthase (glutamine-hydrolysing)
MPGIVGLITNKGREYAEPLLRQMVEALRHEVFYETGTWIDESSGVYVGWVMRRDAFPGGRLIKNERGDRVLFLSGEEFSGPTSSSFFEKNGHGSEVQKGSYLIDLMEEGNSLPTLLNGRFHGLFGDKSTSVSTLFNDRYGMHRLYHHQAKDAFYFAAEAKAILTVRPELRAIDPRGMGELVSCGCVLENRSVFKDIGVLPPGSAWTFRNGSIEHKGCYFEPKEWEDQAPLDLESYYQQLREIFSRNIPKYFSGHEPIAMSLTGGLDSRMIMAWLKAPTDSVKCFSFGGMFRDCQDVTVAGKVAQFCGQQYQVIPVGNEFLAKFPHYSERSIFLTDACVDVSRSSDLYINEIAREIAPVRMTGNYGGEVLRGIRAFKPVDSPPGLFDGYFSNYLEQAKQTYSSLISVHPVSFSVFRQAPWHHYGLQALEQTQLALRSPFLDNEFVQTVFRAPRTTLSSNDISLRLIEDGNPALRKIRTDRGLAGNSGRLATAVRREYLEFTFKAEYAYDYGMPQWVARADHALSALHLERLFLGRHKFYHFRVWYRDALAGYVREMLLDSRTLSRPYLQKQAVVRVVEGHLKGDRNYTMAIHKLLTLEHLHRLFIDS